YSFHTAPRSVPSCRGAIHGARTNTAKKHRTTQRAARCTELSLVLEFQVVEGDDVTVMDAHLLQPVKETGLAQLAVEPVAGLVVAEVDVGHEPLQPGAFHDPGAVVGPV